MEELSYVKFERVWMRNNPTITEKWVHERIRENPEILGLGDLIVRDVERVQPRAGRLDLLLQDAEGDRRYEVEIQLGSTDESHIVRTIEYWDIERKRYPQYDHTAVIVAEDITSRFLNVISLFNGFIPLVAIQMSALRYENAISLVCTTVLDQMILGMPEEEEELEPVDRAYWVHRATADTVGMAEEVVNRARELDSEIEPKFNRHYIGLSKHGQPFNFVTFRPRKKVLLAEFKLTRSSELGAMIEEKGLDLLDFNRWGNYRIRLSREELNEHSDFIFELLSKAYDEATN